MYAFPFSVFISRLLTRFQLCWEYFFSVYCYVYFLNDDILNYRDEMMSIKYIIHIVIAETDREREDQM